MDWVEEGDHLVLSRLTERGRPLLINDICCKSPKAEIKYFCLNVTFVSFAGVEKGICQNPRALAKGGFPLGACWELLPTFTLMAFSVPYFIPWIYISPFHLSRCILNMESLTFKKKKPLAVWQLRNKHVVGFLFFLQKDEEWPWLYERKWCLMASLSVCLWRGTWDGFWWFHWLSWVTVCPVWRAPPRRAGTEQTPAPEETNGYRAWPSSSAAPATASPVAGISLPPMCYIRLAWSGSETVNTPQFRKSAKFAETKRQYRK